MLLLRPLIKKNYYAVPYGMQLQILNTAIQSGNIDEAKLSAQLANAVSVALSDCKAGLFSEILDMPLTDVLTPPAVGHDVLNVEGDKVYWAPPDTDLSQTSTMKVREWLASLPGDSGKVIKRYVSCSVLIKFEGRSVTHRAMAVPTVNPDFPWFIFDGNMVAGWFSYPGLSKLYEPDNILNSKWRDTPVIHDWLSSHTVPDDSCKEDGLCCVESHCGLRLSEFQRRMEAPITTPVIPVTPAAPTPKPQHSASNLAVQPG